MILERSGAVSSDPRIQWSVSGASADRGVYWAGSRERSGERDHKNRLERWAEIAQLTLRSHAQQLTSTTHYVGQSHRLEIYGCDVGYASV